MTGLVLVPSRVVETIERLQTRIDARFPGSGLARICGDLLHTSRAAAARAAEFGRPIVAIRALTWLLVALLAAAIGVHQFDDPVVLEAVGEIEDLTTGLCQKIWQKMNMLQRVDDVRPRPASAG